jgi:hypothetical protein
LLEHLHGEHAQAALLEQRRAVEHDSDLYQPGEQVSRQGKATNHGVLTLGTFGVKVELGGSRWWQATL